MSFSARAVFPDFANPSMEITIAKSVTLPVKIVKKVDPEEVPVKISARNQLKGTVKSVHHGAVNSEVVIEVAPGVEVTSIITKSSAESLSLAPGSTAYAVVKASNVMVAVE